MFGTALLPNYIGFHVYNVQAGDTLSSIAQEFYQDTSLAQIIFEANRQLLDDPNIIVPGQELRIPQSQ